MAQLTFRLLLTVTVIALGPLQFGYHLAELNAPQAVMSCEVLDPATSDCILMDSKQIGLITSINAIGGCLGAAFSGYIADKVGRRRCSFLNCVFFILGPLFMASATSAAQMSLGRFLAGVGAGSSIVVTPVYVNEISPRELRGFLGSMIQLFVNFGILTTQFLGIFWSTEERWRSILFAGGVIGFLNAVLLPIAVESPKWLALNGMLEQSRASLEKLRQSPDYFDDELVEWRADAPTTAASSTNADSPEGATLLDSEVNKNVIGVWEFLSKQSYRRVLIAVVGTMMIQQLSGINSIVFYGVSILSSSLPQFSRTINCFISLMNCFVTAIVGPAIDRYGRKPLLLFSTIGMGVFATLLTFGLVIDSSFISAVSACLFVVSFAAGLGPIPFLIISELTPGPAVGVAQSVATTANWLSTFLIGFLFPILKSYLDTHVFFVFTFTAIVSVVFFINYVPETKGKSTAERVWADFLN